MESRILVISDIHSNLQALESVLEDSRKYGKYIYKYCAGDIVGYGANPNEVIDIIQQEKFTSVLGNHDAMVRGDISDLFNGNENAMEAVEYNKKILKSKNLKYLKSLKIEYSENEILLLHGNFTLKYNELYKIVLYTESKDDFKEGLFNLGNNIIGVFGHTHLPSYGYCYIKNKKIKKFRHDILSLKKESVIKIDIQLENKILKILFNPGSIGQPRNESPLSCYGIININNKKINLEFHSVKYDIQEAQKRIINAGLPIGLAERLNEGR